MKQRSRISKLILWEIVLLFLLGLLFTYGQKIFEITSFNEVLTNLLPPTLVILTIIVITKLFVTVIEPVFKRALQRYIDPYNVNNTWQFISYLIWIIAFIILIILLFGLLIGEQYNTGVGIITGFVIILFVIISHKLIMNFIGWLHIIFSSPLKKGDIIEIDGIKGMITEVTTMSIMLREKKEGLKNKDYTGRKISIPNSFIFTKPIISIPSINSIVWDEIKIIFSTQSDYLHAEDIMVEVAKSIVGSIMKKQSDRPIHKSIAGKYLPSVPTTEFSLGPDGVLITLRYFCKLSDKAEVRSAISEGILKEFKKHHIQPKFR